jgi:CCR4-NOT transcriptional regulation complex NOT5 subunit
VRVGLGTGRTVTEEKFMRRTTSRIVAVAAAGALSLVLAGCGDDDTKESSESSSASEQKTDDSASDASETPADESTSTEAPADGQVGAKLKAVVEQSNEQLSTMKEATKDLYSDIVVESEGESTLIYRYVYKEKVDVKAGKAALSDSTELLKTTAENQVIPSLESAGIIDPEVRYVYENQGGQLIYEKTFSKP